MSRQQVFKSGQWIWCAGGGANQYVLFDRTIRIPKNATGLDMVISASYTYELFINGQFVSRGPVHGDAQWCQYDAIRYECKQPESELEISIVVHHSSGIYLHYVMPASAGVIASFQAGNVEVGTDTTWKCLQLEMWRNDVPKKGWALDYFEDYDAKFEPAGWQGRRFSEKEMAGWDNAVIVRNNESIWGNYQERMVPFIERGYFEPAFYKAFKASANGSVNIADVSKNCDSEKLEPVRHDEVFAIDSVNAIRDKANAFTFDFGKERVGFYQFDIEAPAGITIEVSGAEMIQNGRPWIYRKNTNYSVRYVTRAGRQLFTSFQWNGFRYLHFVIRGDSGAIKMHWIGCVERKAKLAASVKLKNEDVELKQIFELCRYTIEVGVQEHLIDCPTREQTQYWGDAVFVAQSLWKGFGEKSYLRWYLECFLHVPFMADGQISCTYPGSHPRALVDYSLIPLIGQKFYKENTGSFYMAQETFEKASRLKQWYEKRINKVGLVHYDNEARTKEGPIVFIDHPGLGWHNAGHVGIDRKGTSCGLNLFYYGFLNILWQIALDIGQKAKAQELKDEAVILGRAIVQGFFDGSVFHDAVDDGKLSAGTSWQTNCLTVYFDLITGEQARAVMQAMIDGYDRLCRCTPYFHFFFLPALWKTGLKNGAVTLIKREWSVMLRGGATTTWEGFLGDELDTWCHPWSTAPYLFLIEVEQAK